MEREYMIFNVSELSKIDFSQVFETSADTVRKSVDTTKTFVKWDGKTVVTLSEQLDENGLPIPNNPEQYIPSSVSTLTTKEGPYTHSQIMGILSTSVWTDNNITP